MRCLRRCVAIDNSAIFSTIVHLGLSPLSQQGQKSRRWCASLVVTRMRQGRGFKLAAMSELAATSFAASPARPKATRQNIVVLISGTGSNMQALLGAAQQENWRQRWGIEVAAVLSNRPGAPGLATAQAHGVATEVLDHQGFASREAFDAALAQRIDAYEPALVVLAGFMRILTPGFVAHYAGRLVNIHPSLLPAFTGLHTHRRALEAGCQVAGATVHLVTAELDHGQILAQAVVPIVPGDTEASLAARVLTQEHRIYPQAIKALLALELAEPKG